MKIDDKFQRQFPDGKYQSLAPQKDRWGYNIDLSNRYFTPVADKSPEQPAVAFSKEVDPRGLLSSSLGSSLVHTEDNEVLYFEFVDGS